jgi:hypothetical protein
MESFDDIDNFGLNTTNTTKLARDHPTLNVALNETALGDRVIQRQVPPPPPSPPLLPAVLASPNQQVTDNVELRTISQPPGFSLDNIISYGYDNEGQQVFVYVIASGADPVSPVSFPKVDITDYN